MNGKEALCRCLPAQIVRALRALDPTAESRLEEIRVYAGGRVQFVIAGKRHLLPGCVSLDDLLVSLSAHALYSCEVQMAEGYIPLPGGHRAGVCGRMKCQQDGTWRMTDVLSVCIRICRHVPDAGKMIRPFLLDETGAARRVLLLGAPGCGKTTVLRDLALWLARQGLHVAAADEREELFAQDMSVVLPGLDVLCGIEKARAFSMLLRSMAPQVIVSDEIGSQADAQAVLDALRCGVGLLVSAHAGSLEDAMCRPALRRMMRDGAFDSWILLGQYGSVRGVYDRRGSPEPGWEERGRGQLGDSRDGDDRCQCDRVSAFGR